jgi:hypothetical protein
MWARVNGRVLHSLAKPLPPILRQAMPGLIVTTEQMGRAMLIVAKQDAPKRILESRDISTTAPVGIPLSPQNH